MSPQLAGTLEKEYHKTATAPRRSTKNWITSVQMTIVIPPIMAHSTEKIPMSQTAVIRSTPATVLRTNPLVYSLAPCPSTAPIMNKAVVAFLTRAPKR